MGVYEGEVEVKTNDGYIVKVKPDGDKPGVVVVYQKLSPIKLTIFGTVTLIIVATTVWFVKRRILSKFSKKKSR